MPSGFFSLQQLDTAVDAPGLPKCGTCGLLRQCYSPKMEVFGKGRRKILIVGEAPGETEDRQGKPFIGDAGQLLRKVCKKQGLDIDDCWVTNSIVCRPPDNKIDDKYVDSCRPLLLRTIEEKKPNVIILLGASAAKTLIGQEWKRDFGKMGRWVGWKIPSQKYKAWLCPSYHPSYILRMGEDEVLMRELGWHIAAAMELENTPIPDHSKIRDGVEIVHQTTAREMLKELALIRKGKLAFDYETTGLKPDLPEQKIYCCSFCLNGGIAWVTRITTELLPLLSAVLKNPNTKKIASNMKFEERWTRAKLGHGVKGWYWDTMLASHWLDNRPDITSIKFQAYVRLGVAGYDNHIAPFLEAKDANGLNQIHKADSDEVMTYCGLDSLLEYMVAEQQIREYRSMK